MAKRIDIHRRDAMRAIIARVAEEDQKTLEILALYDRGRPVESKVTSKAD